MYAGSDRCARKALVPTDLGLRVQALVPSLGLYWGRIRVGLY